MKRDKHNIPILDLSPEIDILWDDLQDAIQGVLRSGHFIMGPNVKAFEEEVASYLGVKHAVGLNSGTDALYIALKALGIGPGDEVITTPFTFFATAEAISHVGATPVFVDVDTATYNMNAMQVEEALSPRTRAIIPVHLFGQAVDMDPILTLANRHGVKIIEDVAQAFGGEYCGRKLGTIGDVGAYSFFPSKNLGAFGDGGLLVTNDDELASLTRMLRAHGSKQKYQNELVGYNSRLDELQAAILRVKLPHIDVYNQGRREVARRYRTLLSGLKGVIPPEEAAYSRHVYHQYTIRLTSGQRDHVMRALDSAGIGTMVYYPTPVHRLPVYRELGLSMPNAELLALEVLSLPIWPQMASDTQELIVQALRQALK